MLMRFSCTSRDRVLICRWEHNKVAHDLRQTRQGVAIGAGLCRFEEVTVTALDGLPSELGQQARDVVAGCGDQGRSASWHRPAPAGDGAAAMPCAKPARATCSRRLASIRSAPIAAFEPASGPMIVTRAPARPRCLHGDGRLPATRQHADSYAVACQERGRGNQAQHAGARPHRGDVQVGRAPDAAVHIIPVPGSAPGGQPGHRTRGSHRVGDISLRCARRPEHHPVPGVGGHRHHPQAAIEPRAERGDARTQVIKGYPAQRQQREKGGPRNRPARPRGPQHGVHRRQRTVKRNPGQPLKRRAAELTEAGGACWTRPAASSGRRGGRPDASLAATIEPAEVPTKCALCRKSIPPCCPAPARKPDSHASPSVPPTPKTSTSGGFTHNECRSAVRRPPDEVASVHAP